MPLIKSSFKRPVVQSGDDVLTLKLPTGEHVQGVAIVDESGDQAGTNSSPVVVHVENQSTVSGRVESDRDLFGRTRVARPVTLFESVFEYDTLDYLWGDTPSQSNGTFTHIPLDGSVELTVAAGQKMSRRTHQKFKYQAGKSTSAYMTFVLGRSAGTVRRVGVFDDYNGIFILDDGFSTSLVFRSSVSGSVVDTVVPQSQWSEDKLDGTGLSGYTLDTSNVQIMVLEAQGMAVGEIRVGFLIDSTVTYIHEFHTANIYQGRPLSSNTLPITYEIDSTTGSGSLRQYDVSVVSEGGLSQTENAKLIYSVSNGINGTPAQPTLSPTISIKPSLNFKGKQFNGSLVIDNIEILAITNIMWAVILNANLSTPTWVPVDPNSASEYDISSTSFTGGTTILSGFSERKSTGSFEVPLSKIPLSVSSNLAYSDIITIAVADIKGDGGNIFSAINFSESY